MAGNGHIGALVYGKDKLAISLDLVCLWDKRFPGEFKDGNFNFPYLAKSLNFDYQEAKRLFDKCYLHPYPTKINAAEMLFDLPVDEASVFSLDYLTGFFFYERGAAQISGYIDAKKDVLVINENTPFTHSYSLSPYFHKSVKEGGLGYPAPLAIREDGFDGFVQKLYGNAYYHLLCYRSVSLSGQTLFISIAEGKNTAKTKGMLLDYAANEESYRRKHLKRWEALFSKSKVRLPDSKLDALYQKSLYFFLCNSKKGYPLTLQGVWTMNNGRLPPWKSDLHNDINVEMTYDSYLRSGHYGQGKVLVDYLASHKKDFERFASSFMKSKGLLIPGVMSQDAKPLGGWPQYALSPAVSIWALSPLDNYYEFTKDRKFLEEVCYPFFKESEECIFNSLSLIDGVYQFPFHSSPEFYEDDPRSLFPSQTNFELTMLRYLYSKLVSYCSILGLSSLHYQEILSSLPSYYRDSSGCLLIAPNASFDHSHRHFSHMLMYKNLAMVNPYQEREAIRKDIDKVLSYGTEEWAGFSFTEMSSLLSFIHDGEGAYEYLSIFEKAFVHPNGFHMNGDYKRLGYSSLDCYVMTLEANMGYLRAVTDMLLQDSFDVISLFPAIPASFKKKGVSFENLRIKGMHRVSASLKGNEISFVISLVSEAFFKIENRFGEEPVFIVDGARIKAKPNKDGMIEIKAKKRLFYEGIFK